MKLRTYASEFFVPLFCAKQAEAVHHTLIVCILFWSHAKIAMTPETELPIQSTEGL